MTSACFFSFFLFYFLFHFLFFFSCVIRQRDLQEKVIADESKLTEVCCWCCCVLVLVFSESVLCGIISIVIQVEDHC